MGNADESLPSHKRKKLVVHEFGAIWIPNKANLQRRLCIIGHCGRGGHRGSTTTYENLREHYFWNGMRDDVGTFCSTCLHCAVTIGGDRVPRPLGHALHADQPNEIIHFDYLYLFESNGKDCYVLIIKDDASSFVWLEPCAAPDAENTVDALQRWFASFGVVLTWVSDRGSHFKNTVMSSLNRSLHAFHHFTTPYCPQSNGTV